MTKQREVEKLKNRLTKFFLSSPRAYWTNNEVVRKIERLWRLHEAEKMKDEAERKKRNGG